MLWLLTEPQLLTRVAKGAEADGLSAATIMSATRKLAVDFSPKDKVIAQAAEPEWNARRLS